MIIAGEASGDTLAAELVQALRPITHWRFIGAGGPQMAAAGVELTLDLTQHAVVGLWEVLKHYPEFRRIFYSLLDVARHELPDVIIVVDYPGFNMRFIQAIRSIVNGRGGHFHNWNPRIVYYISPQIWAWHSSRLRKIVRNVDLLLSIFPFEKDWYAQRAPDFHVEYVGHPLVDRYPRSQTAADTIHKNEHLPSKSAHPKRWQILLLPGSRIRELNKHLPPMFEAARILARSLPVDFHMVLSSPDLLNLARQQAPSEISLTLHQGGLAQSLENSDLAIASSGTVTMECAYFRVPTIVIYKTSPATYWIGLQLIKVKYLAMANLLADEAVFPELIQNEATGERIAREVQTLVDSPARLMAIQHKLDDIISQLGPSGASHRAAKAIVALCEPASSV